VLLENAKRYAIDVVSGKEVTTSEVKRQCEWFLQDLQKQKEDDFPYYLDENELIKVEGILSLLNFATGLGVVGKPILYNLWDFQCFFLANIFGWRFKEDHKKFRYRDVTLYIARKNAKTFICALILIILMLTEDKYSEFYSICLDRDLAGEVKKAMMQIIEASPAVSKYFKLSTTLSGKIVCKLTDSFYQARTAEASRNNAIRPSAFIADEVAAFRDYHNINAMKSGQLSVRNPLRFKLTTAYPERDSIMLEELDYIRKVYDGVIEDDRMFALLYYAEEGHEWDDIGIMQANPLRIEENYQEIRDNRKAALEKPSERIEYLTKHMNVFVTQTHEEKYIDFEYWKKCEVPKVSFEGKEVVVGVDLSISTDLTAVSIMAKDGDEYYLYSHGFLPEGSLQGRREKFDYKLAEKRGECTITEGMIVSYAQVEEYIRLIEDKYKCKIKCIVSDPFNALQMMESLSKDYDVILLKQTYGNLSPAIKQFRDDVYTGKIKYEKNKLFDWCMSNTTTVKGKTTDDILLAKENKNKARIDLVMASIFCYTQLYLRKNVANINEYATDSFLSKLWGL